MLNKPYNKTTKWFKKKTTKRICDFPFQENQVKVDLRTFSSCFSDCQSKKNKTKKQKEAIE